MDLERLLGRELDLTNRGARVLLDALTELWNQQATQMKTNPRTSSELADVGSLESDLAKLHHWFNPTATGKRLREALDQLPQIRPSFVAEFGSLEEFGDLIEQIDERRVLVGPEGRVAMWIVALGLAMAESDESDGPLWFSQQQMMTAWATLHRTYLEWNRQRLRDVTGLLREETATLRPSAIALLLVLLMNRNTAKARRLPAPVEAKLSSDVSRAIAQPALAFTQALGGVRDSKADARGLEIYRGWATGEIARRLGSGFHREDGIWIDEDTVPAAEDRLVAALAGRPPKQLEQVPFALEALRSEYERVRPLLTTLGIAHERPSVTKRLVGKILRAVQERSAAGVDEDLEVQP
ncbi:MAG: hypothetical protein ACTHKG_21880 [Nocardioides sp.]